MKLASLWSILRAALRDHKAQLRFCLRLTLASLLAFAVAQFGHFPLGGLWAVLTAVIVTQMSVGGSMRATGEYVIGTLGGAIYASALAVLVVHRTTLELAAVLALSTGPLALLAAFNSRFRVAPFTAVIVLLVSTQFGQSPIESAVDRVLEVVLGGMSAIVVSVLVLPERTQGRALEAAAEILDRLADALAQLLTGFTRNLDAQAIATIHNEFEEAVADFQEIAAEAKRERLAHLETEPDDGPLSRTLLRLQHDLVIIGRAATASFPEPFVARLGPLLQDLSESTGEDLRGAAAALIARRKPPSFKPADAAFGAYAAELAALREDGSTRVLSSEEVERLFTLGFALEQLHRNLADLHRCVTEQARVRKVVAAG